MGTNFYVKIRKDEGEFENVHIGKRSAGWKFLFKNNPGYYEPTRRGINRFLVLHKDNFFDEYGELQDPEDFWKDSVDRFNDGFDLPSYFKYRQERGEIVHPWEWAAIRDEFYSDGLLFTEADFS